jgi:hypothetical protein
MGMSQIDRTVARIKKQKEWVGGQTPGGGPSSPYMTQKNLSEEEMQEQDQ